MGREEIVHNLKKLRNPEEIKVSTYQQYLNDAIKYIEHEKKAPKKPNYIEIEWLQKAIIEDMVKGKCDGLVLRKLNYYIWLYGEQK